MKPTITAFKASPDRGRGLARDMRVRWAFEEVGETYDVVLRTFDELKQPAHRALNPFGAIPTYQQDGLDLFESGAIVLHIAERHPGCLLPTEANARSRAITWMFAAVNTVEPPILERQIAMFAEGDKPWSVERIPLIDERIRQRLAVVSDHLGGAEWLDGGFSAADIMMVHTICRVSAVGMLDDYPNLVAYFARAAARPAYRRAFEAQMEVFKASQAA